MAISCQLNWMATAEPPVCRFPRFARSPIQELNWLGAIVFPGHGGIVQALGKRAASNGEDTAHVANRESTGRVGEGGRPSRLRAGDHPRRGGRPSADGRPVGPLVFASS